MENSHNLKEAAKAVLDDFGYTIKISVSKVEDEREFDPDYVVCSLAKEDKLMFRTGFRTNLVDEIYDPEGVSVIEDCLDIRTKSAYQEQAQEFDLRIAEYLQLKQQHKFTHNAEKKILKDHCERLMSYRENYEPQASAEVYANIPLIEANVDELQKLAGMIRNACKQAEADQMRK